MSTSDPGSSRAAAASEPPATSGGAVRIATVLTSIGLLWFFVPAGTLVFGRGTVAVVAGVAMLLLDVAALLFVQILNSRDASPATRWMVIFLVLGLLGFDVAPLIGEHGLSAALIGLLGAFVSVGPHALLLPGLIAAVVLLVRGRPGLPRAGSADEPEPR